MLYPLSYRRSSVRPMRREDWSRIADALRTGEIRDRSRGWDLRRGVGTSGPVAAPGRCPIVPSTRTAARHRRTTRGSAMADLEAVMDEAGLTNPKVREFVKEYAELTGAERVEVVNASDDARLLEEAVAAGELQRAGEGRYYSRSYYKDTARSEERTIVATNDEKDRGVYNNWRPASEMKPMLHDRMRGASEGKTMYVIPYLMSPRRQRARAVGRRRRAHRHPHRRAPHDPHVARRRAVRQRPRGPRLVRPRRPRHRRPRAPRPGHRRRPALLRHGRRRAHDPALRVVLRRQRAARQDRARPAAGRVRRLGEQEVPRRAVHAHRHPRQGDREGPTTSAAASRAPRARPTWR